MANGAPSLPVDVVETGSTHDDPDQPQPGIAVCLSGGGYRAMVFHLGALWRLNELGYLGRLDRVSSVSGGSITAGLLGLKWPRLAFDAAGTSAAFVAEVVEPIRKLASTTIDRQNPRITSTRVGDAPNVEVDCSNRRGPGASRRGSVRVACRATSAPYSRRANNFPSPRSGNQRGAATSKGRIARTCHVHTRRSTSSTRRSKTPPSLKSSIAFISSSVPPGR